MEKRMLGKTGIELSCLGYGCASVWGKTFYDEKEAMSLFFHAISKGISYFDTGFSYGVAEERLGRCLKQLSSQERSDIVFSTKCGTRIGENGKAYHDWDVKWLNKSVETSLKRLGVERIPMLLLHGPSIQCLNDDVVGFMNGLKDKGVVGAIGANSFDSNVLEYICDNEIFDFVMLDYNIMKQDREPLIKKLADKSIGVIAGAPLAESLFSNRVFKVKSKKDIWYLLRALKNFRGHLFNGFDYRFINKLDSITGNQVALRFVLDNPNITSAVFGTTNKDHLDENVLSVVKEIPSDIMDKIIKTGNGGK